MFIANFLSRDYVHNCSKEEKYINDYVHIINTKKVEFSIENLKKFQTEPVRDPILNKLLERFI